MKIIIFILLLIIFPVQVLAAIDCTDEGLAAAFASASSGDTITCNSGTFTFNSNVTLSGKSIKLVGSGATLNMTASILVNSSGSKAIEISGFVFNIQTGESSQGIATAGDSTGTIYIHDNQFYTLYPYAISSSSASHTLIANNTFGSQSTRSANEPLFFQSNDNKMTAMRKEIGFGQNFSSSVDWTFVESNTFWMVGGTLPGGATFMDSTFAGKAVIRYNTIHDGYLVTHGICEGGWAAAYGTRALEIYNNTFIIHDGVSHYQWMDLKPAAYVVHNNRLELWGTGSLDNPFVNWEHQRTDPAAPPPRSEDQNCDGDGWAFLTHGYNIQFCSGSDQTTLGNWYACTPTTNDNCAAWGKGTCTKKLCSNAWTLCTTADDCTGGGTCDRYADNPTGHMTFAGYATGRLTDGTPAYIASEPMYLWSNSVWDCNASGGECSQTNSDESRVSDVTNAYVVLNTDVFNSAKPGYSIATCPHPLAGSGSCSGSVTGTAGYTLGVAAAQNPRLLGGTIQGGVIR